MAFNILNPDTCKPPLRTPDPEFAKGRSCAEFEPAVQELGPHVAALGMRFYTGRMFPAWDGNLFVATLAGKHLARLVLNGNRVVAEERLLADQNARFRTVHQGPDGALYVLIDGAGGKILRLKK